MLSYVNEYNTSVAPISFHVAESNLDSEIYILCSKINTRLSLADTMVTVLLAAAPRLHRRRPDRGMLGDAAVPVTRRG